MTELRKQVTVGLMGQELHLDIGMSMLEAVEAVYDLNINFVPVILQNSHQVKLTQLADLYLRWLTTGQVEQLGGNRKAIREWIYCADEPEIRVLVGALQAACLYYRRKITADELDILQRGEDLPGKDLPDGEPSQSSTPNS